MYTMSNGDTNGLGKSTQGKGINENSASNDGHGSQERENEKYVQRKIAVKVVRVYIILQ